MRQLILAGIFYFSLPAFSQVILTEIMYDASGAEKSDEFIEIYNTSTSLIDLTSWQVGDGASFDFLIEVNNNGLTLQSQQYGLIFDSDYFADSSTTYNNLIPPDALILSIDGITLGSGGLSNSTAETVVLITSASDTVQRYTYSLGNTPGFSDEKVELNEDNSTQNWGESFRFNGTPGGRNSLTPAELNLGITRFTLRSSTFIAGATVPFEAVVKNFGKQDVAAFEWLTFYDLNNSQIPEQEEVLELFLNNTPIMADDTLLYFGEFVNIPFGELTMGVAVMLEGDEDTTNNILLQTVYVDNPGGEDIFINEIMAEPLPNYSEWVELYNNSSKEINLRNIYFADAHDTIQISSTDKMMQPGEYIVLGKDSTLAYQYSLSFEGLIINKKFPTMNNDFDDLRLLGRSLLAYDRVSYTSNWYGRDINPGTSLEKINPAFNGQVAQNWAASVSSTGSTPGAQNSVLVEVLPSENQLEISPNPFSPDSDGFEDFTVLQFKFGVETAFISIRIFDTRGRMIRYLANGEPVAHQGQFVWDGKDDEGRVARIGAYICLVQALNSDRRVQVELKQTIILVKK
jgi:hypothetical protein